MKKIKFILIALAAISIIRSLSSIDYNDLAWANNAGSYKLILAMICVIVSMVLLKIPKPSE
ncbi:hypothetical protein [Aureispira anguillae]|uniref:Uncharacterized protein n=1 Tax=Aureispira anguillae TaxID=2864201 RepID=A0A916DPG5_9BACT|nr:hypothetical protein [Aureispira anguillae]BDS10131.1 hypothetical protein AsAng_0008390 [Aureispira anguillae]